MGEKERKGKRRKRDGSTLECNQVLICPIVRAGSV